MAHASYWDGVFEADADEKVSQIAFTNIRSSSKVNVSLSLDGKVMHLGPYTSPMGSCDLRRRS